MLDSTKQDDKMSGITMVIIFNSIFFYFRKTNPNLLPVSYNGKHDSFKRLEGQKTMLKSFSVARYETQIEKRLPYNRKF